MDETSNLDAATRSQALVFAKILLRKFNILDDFHVQQLQRYLIACCPAAIGGEVSVVAESRIVHFDIKTNFFFKSVKRKIVPRHKYSASAFLQRLNKKAYKKETDQAILSLTGWTKELLWGPETQVKVTIDGREL
jgi:hypothetical protein